MQDYAEETEGSNLDNSECEYSSDDSVHNNNQSLNKKLKCTNIIPIKRKNILSNNKSAEESEPPKKSQKTIYMESFSLTPCSVALEPLDNLESDENNVNTEKMPSKKTSDTLEKVSDELPKAGSENVQCVSSINAEKISDEVLNIVTKDNKNNDENLSSYNAEESLADTDGDGTLVIDEGMQVDEIIPEKSQENEAENVENNEQPMDTSTISIDSEDNNPIITEPEVIIHESKEPKKDVIEINELDDSDVEITSFETTKVPVQNKKTLESIIKSSMYKLNSVCFPSKKAKSYWYKY